MPELAADLSVLPGGTLKRDIGWSHAFWVATGAPALVLFSIGATAATVGNPSWLVWTISIAIGFIQAFTYAEIAGMYPTKSGGGAICGAMAWLPYGRVLGPISVWTNWLGWSPVLSIGTSIAAGYVLSVLFAPDAAINTWSITLIDLGFLQDKLLLRLNATAVLGAVLILLCFAIQHCGILGSARIQTWFAVCSLLPLTLIGLAPILTGDLVVGRRVPAGDLQRELPHLHLPQQQRRLDPPHGPPELGAPVPRALMAAGGGRGPRVRQHVLHRHGRPELRKRRVAVGAGGDGAVITVALGNLLAVT